MFSKRKRTVTHSIAEGRGSAACCGIPGSRQRAITLPAFPPDRSGRPSRVPGNRTSVSSMGKRTTMTAPFRSCTTANRRHGVFACRPSHTKKPWQSSHGFCISAPTFRVGRCCVFWPCSSWACRAGDFSAYSAYSSPRGSSGTC